jgi:hypothetical protein
MSLDEEDKTRIDGRLDAAFTGILQHILHEVGRQFDEVDAKLESIDSRLKIQVDLLQSALARFSESEKNIGGAK